MKGKNPHAVALGRLGGLKGGPERAQRLPPYDRTRIAKIAAWSRSLKYAKEALERLKTMEMAQWQIDVASDEIIYIQEQLDRLRRERKGIFK